MRRDDPALLQSDALGVHRPKVERQIVVAIAGVACFSDQLGQTSAATAAATHGITFELQAGPLRAAGVNTNLIKKLFYERWSF